MIYPFPIIRIHPTDRGLTALALRFAAAKDLEVVETTAYRVTVIAGGEKLNLWDSGRFYAWGGRGVYTNSEGRSVPWEGMMPSRWAVRKLSRAIDLAKWGAR